MKRKDFQQFQSQSTSEISQEIAQLEKDIVTMKMKLLMRQETNVRAYKNKRHDLARLKTLLHEKNAATK